MGTVRAGSLSSSQTREPPVYPMGPPVHARIADILRRDLCHYVHYALRRWKATPALLYVTAHEGRRGRR